MQHQFSEDLTLDSLLHYETFYSSGSLLELKVLEWPWISASYTIYIFGNFVWCSVRNELEIMLVTKLHFQLAEKSGKSYSP